MAEQIKFFANYGIPDGDVRRLGGELGNVNAARLYIPLWYGGTRLDSAPFSGMWTQPIDFRLNTSPGVYTYDSKDCHAALPAQYWVSNLTSRHGDHHRPNPLFTCWLGGTVYLQNAEQIGPTGRAASINGYWERSNQGDIGSTRSATQPLPLYGYDRYNVRTYNGKPAPTTIGYENRFGLMMPTAQEGFNGSSIYMRGSSDGVTHFSDRPSLYGPNYIEATVDGFTATVHMKCYRSWVSAKYNNLAQETTYRATIVPSKVQVFASGAVSIVAGSVIQSYEGYYRESGVANKRIDESGNRILTIGTGATSQPLMFNAVPLPRGGVTDEGDPETHFAVLRSLLYGTLGWYTLRSVEHKASDRTSGTKAKIKALKNQPELSSNWLENFTGFKNPLSLFEPIAYLVAGVKNKNPAQVLKAISSAYLEWKYVIAPGISDYKDVKANAPKLWDQYIASHPPLSEIRKGSVAGDVTTDDPSTAATWSCSYNLENESTEYRSIWLSLCAFNVEPSLANLWDLIPYSFVVDWLVPIGSALELIDNMFIGTFLYQSCLWSLSYVEDKTVMEPIGGNTFPLHYHFCERDVGFGVMDLNPFDLTSACDPNLSASQWAQGTALAVQRIL